MTQTLINNTLNKMQQHAVSLGVQGAAVAGYLEDGNTLNWHVDLCIVGAMKTVNGEGKGFNFVGVAFQKACEAMDTHQNSGSKVRPTLSGECGWPGSVIAEANGGFVLTAFSGGTSEQDVEIAAKGLEYMKEHALE